MRKILKKSTIVLVMLTFILAMVNVNGVNTSFADTKDSTQTTTTTTLGYPAWTGTTSGKVSDSDILSALGIGIVSYRDVPEAELQAPDYTYRVDTDVITSITLTTTEEVNPDDPASVTFHINGRDYTVTDIVIPENGSQIVWAKWHTPSEPTTLTITVSVSGATTAKTSFVARIISLEENLPPDPLATDTNPHFSTPSLPDNPLKLSASWSVWSASWHANWEWESDWDWESGSHDSSCPADCSSSHGHWVDNGEWVDNGWYDFTSTSYSASLTGSMEIHPDDIVPTAVGDTMKSGYGIKESATAQCPISRNFPTTTTGGCYPAAGEIRRHLPLKQMNTPPTEGTYILRRYGIRTEPTIRFIPM